MSTISQEEFSERVSKLSDGRFKLVSEYRGKNHSITLWCNIHNKEFSGKGDWFCHGTDVRGNCPDCSREAKESRYLSKRKVVECAYCHKPIFKEISHMRAKSGLYFCCNEHKNIAAKLDSGKEFAEMRPSHFGSETATVNTYRKIALRTYPNRCSVCGYEEGPDSLEVHHIDENRENNALENLIVLCPNCHRKLTNHKYKLVGRTRLEKCS